MYKLSNFNEIYLVWSNSPRFKFGMGGAAVNLPPHTKISAGAPQTAQKLLAPVTVWEDEWRCSKDPQTPFGGTGAENPAQPPPKNLLFIQCNANLCPTHPIRTMPTRGGAARRLTHRVPHC
jgi:hypothetical protein